MTDTQMPIFTSLLEQWVDRTTVIVEAGRAGAELVEGGGVVYAAPVPERDPDIPPPFIPATQPPALAHSGADVGWAWTEGDRFRPEETLVEGGEVFRPQGDRVLEADLRRAGRWRDPAARVVKIYHVARRRQGWRIRENRDILLVSGAVLVLVLAYVWWVAVTNR